MTASKAKAMIAAYFNQTIHYYSESEDAMIPIAEMDPKHAANAAEAILRDAFRHAADAGVTERPYTWAANAPLVRELWDRGQATLEARSMGILSDAHEYQCMECSYRTDSRIAARGHWVATAHRFKGVL